MKKLITLALAVMLVTAFATLAAANAGTGYSITASRGTPVVDGVKDDIWDTCEVQAQDRIRNGTDTGTHVAIRFLYDDDNLYLLAEVPDASLWTKDLSLASMTYNMDGAEICLSLTNSSATSIDTATDAWVGVTPYGDFYSSQANWLVGSKDGVSADNETFDAEFMEVHTSLENDPDNDQANPYYIEAVWHIKAYDAQYAPADGVKYGFEISYNDNAEYNNRTMCIGWSDITDGASTNPSVWGEIVLGAAGADAAAPAEGELANYAKGASVTVSSTETADFPGELAVDGDLETRWASQYTDDEQITIDLGAIKPIGYIELYWETALASDFEIYTGSSADNLQEHTIATVTGNADQHNVFEFDLTTARYITIHCSKRATEWGNSLYEVIVRKSADEVVSFAGPEGYPSSGCEVPDGSVIINGERIGLEEGWGGNAAAGRDAAFDGDVNTFFDPLGTGNGWAGIDAGEEYTLTKIMIHPRDGQLTRFNGAEIDGSNDPDFEDYTALWISVEEADEFKWYEINSEDFDDHGSFRYYRYFNMTNHGDVADVELYGYPTAGGPGSAAAPVEEAPADPNAPAILWDFNSDGAMDANMGANSGANTLSWTADKDDAGNEYYTFTASGADPYVSVDLSAADVSDVVWAKARVKNAGPATAIELFGHTNDRGLTGSECTHINVGTDGEWHTYIIYIPDENVTTVNAYKDPQYAITEPYWEGTVDWIRLDPMWQEGDDGNDAGGSMNDGDQIMIDYIAFFSSEEAAKAFRSELDSEYVASSGFASAEDAAAGKNVISGYEFVSGTEGFGGEGSENLWDGETSTKFCTNQFPAESIVKLDGTYNITGFTMATANDNADYNGRSPNAWTISVSADGENWTELAKGDDSFFEETNFTYYAGDASANGVSYVKFNAEGTASGTFQVSELTLFGDKAEEVTAPVDETLDQKAEAPNTFDFGITAAVAAVISLAGFAAAKKKH